MPEYSIGASGYYALIPICSYIAGEGGTQSPPAMSTQDAAGNHDNDA